MGREMIKENLEEIRTKKGIQFIVANGENIAHGNGITNNYYKFLLDNHVNIVTLGNHSFANHDVFNFCNYRIMRLAEKPQKFNTFSNFILCYCSSRSEFRLCSDCKMSHVHFFIFCNFADDIRSLPNL